MKATRIIVICILCIAAAVMSVLVVKSVTVPIKFEKECERRNEVVIDHLKDLREAMKEYHLQKGVYTDNLDSLVIFLQTTPKLEIKMEGELTEWHLEHFKLDREKAEQKAVELINAAKDRARNNTKLDLDFSNDSILYDYIWNNDEQIRQDSLMSFSRDTIEVNMIQYLYKGKYDEKSIADMIICPFSNGQKFEVSVDNNYETTTKDHSKLPLFEIRAPYTMYLSDLNKQELINLIDRKAQEEVKRQDPEGVLKLKKKDVFTGLKVGDVKAPNNFAGNWE